MTHSFTKMSLDDFKNKVLSDSTFADKFTNKSDIVDLDNGSMTIHRSNINKYLEKYMCKSEEDLTDTLWYSYGVFVRVVD